MNKIKQITITNFRHLNNLQNIKVGEKLTVIAGGNGTGKSSLLGLIGHIFSYRDEKNIIVKSIDNKPLETEFKEVFRFSPNYDYLTPYSYSLIFADGTTKAAISRYIVKNKRFRIDVGARQRFHGKARCPVVFLGLKRLIPLAQESEYSIKLALDSNLSAEDKKLYQDWHNKVLVLDDKVVPQHTKSRNKELYSPVCEKYDALGNSAGQDNLAQIILAILSFKKLKDELKTDYLGGILLIDEIDTTLFPAAQYQLMDLLQKVAKDYDLQIIFTTHSIEIIRYMLNPADKQFFYSTEIIYLHKTKGTIEVCQEKSKINGIVADLQHDVCIKPVKNKINVYLEDEEARLFFKGLISSDLKAELNISRFNEGGDFYNTLLQGAFPEFRKSLIIFDGDKSSDKRINRNKNVLFLPGTARPENVFFSYLSGLPENDLFWTCEIGGYNKQVFLRHRPANTTDRNIMKEWFNKEKVHWGAGCGKLFKRWKSDNHEFVDRFCTELGSKLNKLKS